MKLDRGKDIAGRSLDQIEILYWEAELFEDFIERRSRRIVQSRRLGRIKLASERPAAKTAQFKASRFL